MIRERGNLVIPTWRIVRLNRENSEGSQIIYDIILVFINAVSGAGFPVEDFSRPAWAYDLSKYRNCVEVNSNVMTVTRAEHTPTRGKVRAEARTYLTCCGKSILVRCSTAWTIKKLS